VSAFRGEGEAVLTKGRLRSADTYAGRCMCTFYFRSIDVRLLLHVYKKKNSQLAVNKKPSFIRDV